MTKFVHPHSAQPREVIKAATPKKDTLTLAPASLQTTMERLQRKHPEDVDIRRAVVGMANVASSMGRDRVPKSAAWFAARSVYAQKTGRAWVGEE